MQTNKQNTAQVKRLNSRPTIRPAKDTRMVRVSADFQQFLKEHKQVGRTEIQFADELQEYWEAGHGESVMDVPTFQKIMDGRAAIDMQNRYLLECLFFAHCPLSDQQKYVIGELKALRQRVLTELNVQNNKGEENAIIAVWNGEAKAEGDPERLLTWYRGRQKTVVSELYFNHKIHPYALEKHGGLSKLFTDAEQNEFRTRLEKAAATGEVEAEANRIIAEIDRRAVEKKEKEAQEARAALEKERKLAEDAREEQAQIRRDKVMAAQEWFKKHTRDDETVLGMNRYNLKVSYTTREQWFGIISGAEDPQKAAEELHQIIKRIVNAGQEVELYRTDINVVFDEYHRNHPKGA
jgi:ribosomal protein L22